MKNSEKPDTNIPNFPKISIVTPSLNQGKFLEDTIQSVLSQGYPNLEYIIMDGGSTDESIEIIKRYENQISHWESKKDKGQTDAINRGMARASGDVVNWLNSDDILFPNSLFEVAAKFTSTDSRSKKAVFCGDAQHIDEKGNVIKFLPIRFLDENQKILPSAPPYSGGIQASWFLTHDAWLFLGGVNLTLNYTMDTDLYYRCQTNGFPFFPISKALAAYRVHQDTKTQSGWEKSIEYKRRFYESQLNLIGYPKRKVYSLRIHSMLFGFCLNSISPKDKFRTRLKKIFKGLDIYPGALFSKYHIGRILRALIV